MPACRFDRVEARTLGSLAVAGVRDRRRSESCEPAWRRPSSPCASIQRPAPIRPGNRHRAPGTRHRARARARAPAPAPAPAPGQPHHDHQHAHAHAHRSLPEIFTLIDGSALSAAGTRAGESAVPAVGRSGSRHPRHARRARASARGRRHRFHHRHRRRGVRAGVARGRQHRVLAPEPWAAAW